MKNIIALILIIAGVSLFFGYTQGSMNRITELRSKRSDQEKALMAIQGIEKEVSKLDSSLKKITQAQDDKLNRMLPQSVENVKLIIDFSNILKETIDNSSNKDLYKTFDIENPKISDSSLTDDFVKESSKSNSSISNENLGVAEFGFTVNLTYQDFRNFLYNLEKSTRIFDIKEINFTSKSVGENTNPKDSIYTFNVILKTYWHKNK